MGHTLSFPSPCPAARSGPPQAEERWQSQPGLAPASGQREGEMAICASPSLQGLVLCDRIVCVRERKKDAKFFINVLNYLLYVTEKLFLDTFANISDSLGWCR